MKFSTLSSAQLNQIARLISKKETLLNRVEAIDRQLSKFEGLSIPATRKSKAAAAPAASKGGKRNIKLKDAILKALTAAGSKGIQVGELAKKLRVKPGNVFSWFYTTGKKNPAIKKVGEAQYALVK